MPSKVDIITPVYGQPQFLRGLMESMRQYETGVDYHWWVVDDKGPQTPELSAVYAELKEDERVTVLMSPINRGFAGANNEAFRRGKSPFVLMLNSDTRIKDNGWLRQMLVEMWNDENVGVVGPMLTFFDDDTAPEHPAGKVQHAGVAFNMLGQPYHIFAGWDPTHPKVNQRREMNAVTGACLLTRRKVYHKLGGLDTIYTTGNFEDVQFCLQVRAAGLKVIYTPQTILNHYSGGSNNNATANVNAGIFQTRCRGIIPHDDWMYW